MHDLFYGFLLCLHLVFYYLYFLLGFCLLLCDAVMGICFPLLDSILEFRDGGVGGHQCGVYFLDGFFKLMHPVFCLCLKTLCSYDLASVYLNFLCHASKPVCNGHQGLMNIPITFGDLVGVLVEF